MYAVFQDIVRMARVELEKALMCDVSSWDSDAFEQQVREFTRQLGLESIHVWAELKGVQAAEQAAICACGQRRQVHKRKQTWWLTTFGRVATVEPYLSCPGCLSHARPFQRLTGLKCRGKSMSLQRVLTDFGAEKSFGGASQQLWEHYRVKLDRSSVREVVREQAQRAEEFVGAECQKAVSDYQRRKEAWPGEQWLIVESDGSMVRTGELEACPQGEESPKRRRKTQWRD